MNATSPLRKGLGRARRAAIRRLGGLVPELDVEPPGPGLPLSGVLDLLYPTNRDRELLHQVARDIVASDRVVGLPALRSLLSRMERQVAPSPLLVRWGRDDVAEIEVDGMRMLVDPTDASVSGHLLHPSGYEAHLGPVFSGFCSPGATVVDVGANIGYYTLLAAKAVGSGGRVVAIEANPEDCRLLLASAAMNGLDNVEVLPVALDRKRGWACFTTHIGTNGGFMAAGERELTSGLGFVVATFPLDELLDEPVHLLKLDVEGAEGRVLEGAQSLVEKHRPVVITELSRSMLSMISGTSAEDYLAWYCERGYRIQLVDRAGGDLIDMSGPDELLSGWVKDDRIEDLLLLPG